MEKKTVNIKVSCDSCKHEDYCKYEGLHKIKRDFNLALSSEEHFPIIEVELKCKYYESDINKKISENFNNRYVPRDLLTPTATFYGSCCCSNKKKIKDS